MSTRTLAIISGILVLSAGCAAAGQSPTPSDAVPAFTPLPPALPTPTPVSTATPAPTLSPAARGKAAAKVFSYKAKGSSKTTVWEPLVLNVSGHFVIHHELKLFGFSATGKKKWQREIPDGAGDDNQSAHTVNLSTPSDTLIVTYKKPVGKSSIWPAPHVVEALDPATGRTLWKATSSWGATYGHIGLDDTVYTSACRGTQTGKRDECRLSARDPRTGRVRWTVPTEQLPSIVTGDATTLVMTTLPRGFSGNSWLTALDRRTGARLGLHVEVPRFAGRAVTDYASRIYLKDRTVAVTLSRANVEAQRCDYVAAGRDVRTGDRVWRATWRDPGCGHDRFSGGSAIPAVTGDGRLTLRDPATGKIVWKDVVSGRVVTLDGREVLVDSGEGLKLYGRARTWTLPDRPPGLPLLTGRRVLLAGQQETLVYDRRTGKLIASAKGDHAGAGDAWVATSDHNADGTTIFVIYRV